ncbi:MAG: hypothetical protein ABL900_09955, partial [Burkholderiaceae bacterium]
MTQQSVRAPAWFCRRLLACLAVLTLVVAPARAWAADAVVLYVSPTTQAYFPTAGGRYEAMVKPWRDLLAAQPFVLREVSRPEELSSL